MFFRPDIRFWPKVKNTLSVIHWKLMSFWCFFSLNFEDVFLGFWAQKSKNTTQKTQNKRKSLRKLCLFDVFSAFGLNFEYTEPSSNEARGTFYLWAWGMPLKIQSYVISKVKVKHQNNPFRLYCKLPSLFWLFFNASLNLGSVVVH